MRHTIDVVEKVSIHDSSDTGPIDENIKMIPYKQPLDDTPSNNTVGN